MRLSEDLLLVGRVARAHGNRAQVIVNPETDFAEDRFAIGRVIQVSAGGRIEARRIESVRFHQGRPVIGLEGVGTMNAAQALAGADLFVAAADVAPLPEHTYYRHDLVGCEVRDGHGQFVGRVTAVDGPRERSHLVVAGARGEVLIPLTGGICVEVDPQSGRIVIDPPEGLLEVNAGQAGHAGQQE